LPRQPCGARSAPPPAAHKKTRRGGAGREDREAENYFGEFTTYSVSIWHMQQDFELRVGLRADAAGSIAQGVTVFRSSEALLMQAVKRRAVSAAASRS